MTPSEHPLPEFQLTDSLTKGRDEFGRSMINGYVRGQLIGKGQHGSVFIAHTSDNTRQVAIKAIKRNNPRENKMKALRRTKIPPTPGHVSLSAGLTSTEHKIRKEIAIMKKCRHAHVVRLYEVIDDKLQNKIYMVMEYMAGGEIKWRNSANQPILLVDQTRRIIRDVVLGLEYLHHNGIIHRDIKPANLLWTADRRTVKIADFGVSHFSYAQSLGEAQRHARLAASSSKPASYGIGHTHAPLWFKAGSSGRQATLPDVSRLRDPRDRILLDESDLSKTAGTPTFMAPEVVADMTGTGSETPVASRSRATSTASSSRESSKDYEATLHRVGAIPRRAVTKAIDVWALGVTLYALLFGSPPFLPEPGQTEFALYRLICEKAWVAPPTMGLDRLKTGGTPSLRSPTKGDKKGKGRAKEPEVDMSQPIGTVVMKLLDRLLQKDADKRITLDEVKRYPWFLTDITDFDRWIQDTAPSATEELFITEEETSEAMSDVRFRWRKRIKNFVKRAIRPVSSIPALASDAQATSGGPIARQKSATAKLGWHPGVQDNHPGRRLLHALDTRHPSSPEIPTLRAPRSQSTERPPVERRAGARRGSETHLIPPGARTPSTAGASPAPSVSGDAHEKPHRQRLSITNLFTGFRSKPSSPPPLSAAPSAGPSAPPSAVSSTLNSPTTSGTPSSRAGFGSGRKRNAVARAGSSSALQGRYSEDVFGRPLGGHSYSVGSGHLSAEMRASSWGDPADYGAYARRHEDVTSVHSGEQLAELLDEDVLLFGAGGVASEPPMPLPPSAASSAPVSPVLAPASAVPVSLLQRVENEVPSTPDPGMRETGGFPRATTGVVRPHAVSPLASELNTPYDSSSDEYDDGAEQGYDSNDDDGFVQPPPSSPPPRDEHSENENDDERELRLRTHTSRIYEEDDDDDDESSLEAAPVEIKRRRPSEVGASSPPCFR